MGRRRQGRGVINLKLYQYVGIIENGARSGKRGRWKVKSDGEK